MNSMTESYKEIQSNITILDTLKRIMYAKPEVSVSITGEYDDYST